MGTSTSKQSFPSVIVEERGCSSGAATEMDGSCSSKDDGQHMHLNCDSDKTLPSIATELTFENTTSNVLAPREIINTIDTASNEDNETTPLVSPHAFSLRSQQQRQNEIHNCEENMVDKARRLLYISHFFAQFSEVSWQFSLTLFLAAFANYESLVLVSTYGFTQGLIVCLFGATAGRFVDGTNRLHAARFFIASENISVLIATAFCCILLSMQQNIDTNPNFVCDDDTKDQQFQPAGRERQFTNNDTKPASGWFELNSWSIACLIGIHIFGPLAQILDQGFLVAIERDWVVIMSEQAALSTRQQKMMMRNGNQNSQCNTSNHSDDAEDTRASTKEAFTPPAKAVLDHKLWLSETNVMMRRIDLTCKIAAPAVAGIIIGIFDPDRRQVHQPHYGNNLTGAAILVGVVNVAALIVEYICTARIYDMVPALAVKHKPCSRVAACNSLDESDVEQIGITSIAKGTSSRTTSNKNMTTICSRISTNSECVVWRLPYGLNTYLDQKIAWAGIALSLLYLNALTFGALMTAYLVWRGMRLETVGIWRGVSSAVGLGGTFVYHYSVQRNTIVQTGMWSIFYQFVCISLSFGALFIQSFDLSVTLLIIGVCASRVGLWVFDISVTQLMQEFIPDDVRGVVGGTQQALNAFFMLLTFALGIVFPDPKEFHVYVAAGYAAVGVGVILYAFGVYRHPDGFLLLAEKTTQHQ